MKLAQITKHKLTGNLIALYSAHVARYLFPLITIPYLARVLGVEVWGMLAFIQAYGVFVSQFIEYGFGLSGTREVAQQRHSQEELSHILSQILGAQILLALTAIGATLVAYPFVPLLSENPRVLWFGVAAAVTQAFHLLWYFRGLERMRLVATLDVLTKALAVAGIFILVRSPEDVWKVFVSYILANFILLILAISIAYRDISFHFPALSNILNTLQKGWSLFLVRAGATFFSAGNIFILGLFATPTEVGYFAGALKIVTAIRGLLSPAVDALLPKLSYLVSVSRDEAVRFIRKIFVIMNALGLALSVFVFLGARTLIVIILGDGFGPAIPVLQILSLLPVLIALAHVLGPQWMIPLGMDRSFSLTIISGGVLNITLSILFLTLGTNFSVVAWAMIISQVYVSAGLFILLKIKGALPSSKLALDYKGM